MKNKFLSDAKKIELLERINSDILFLIWIIKKSEKRSKKLKIQKYG